MGIQGSFRYINWIVLKLTYIPLNVTGLCKMLSKMIHHFSIENQKGGTDKQYPSSSMAFSNIFVVSYNTGKSVYISYHQLTQCDYPHKAVHCRIKKHAIFAAGLRVPNLKCFHFIFTLSDEQVLHRQVISNVFIASFILVKIKLV